MAARRGCVEHQQAVEWLIDFGELEAGLADVRQTSVCPHSADRLKSVPRRIALGFGHVFVCSWKKNSAELERRLVELGGLLEELTGLPLPENVSVGTPEGYAYYSLYPETYLAAAERCVDELRPAHAVCIGIRSIGTSLSAVVAATLEQRGVPVQSFTVRPDGHPFDRRLRLSTELAQQWRAQRDAHFLIVDEGPGLSGSSFCSTAHALTELGVTENRIVFFPSWQTDGAQFVNAEARRRWPRHPKFTATFEQVRLQSGRLSHGDALTDIAAGQWRALFYRDEDKFPAVHPQHERRKYLVKAERLWLKFAGLGRYGQAKLSRAEALAAAGFAPRALGLADGFLKSEFVKGQPLTRNDVCPALLTTIARYLAFLRANFPTEQTAPDDIREMMRVNLTEALGEARAERLLQSDGFKRAADAGRACAIDGRMLPHEWLRTADGYIKTDGLDHHDDHFYPSCQDIAWDVAGCCVEFALNREQRKFLIEQYRRVAEDADIAARLPFYLLAYTAFRLGYATMAANQLKGTADGARFDELRARYAANLERDGSPKTNDNAR